MAVYKVIQDVEAEDKILGPLTLKGFIYAIITVVLLYVGFRLSLATSLGPIRWFIILALFFPTLLFGVLASPLGREQPTEIWLLSRIRFFLQPRKRIWDQAGISELVTITAPKGPDRILTKNLTQKEVRSRLKALATTLDSRGWAVKNVAVNLTSHPDYLDSEASTSDRLIDASDLPQPVVITDVHPADDILDPQHNATAQHFEALMQKADTDRKKEVMQKVEEARKEKTEEPPEDTDYQFLDRLPPTVDETGNTVFVGRKIISPASSTSTSIQSEDDSDITFADKSTSELDDIDEAAKDFLEHEHRRAEAIHAKAPHSILSPHKEASQAKVESQKPAVTEVQQAVKLKELSEVAKDDKLTTLATMAKRETGKIKQIGPNELEIDLH